MNDQIFQQITVHLQFFAHLQSIFPILRVRKTFLENPALSRTTSYGFLAPCQNLDKTNYIIPRKVTDRWKDGRTGRFYFSRPFQLLARFQSLFFFNWDSLFARLNGHYKAWNCEKKKHNKTKAYR